MLKRASCACPRSRSRLLCLGFLVAVAGVAGAGPSQANDAEKARQARELVQAGKPEEAIPIYEELIRAAPGEVTLRMNLCIAQYKAKRFRDAIESAEAVLRARPDLVTAHLFLGASYLDLGEAARAVAPLERVVAAQPNERNARLMLGQALLAFGHSEEAVTHLQAAASLMPDNPKAWLGLVRTYEALAARAAQELDSGAPGSGYWHAWKAEEEKRRRRYGAALRHYREALIRLPALSGLHAGLAEMYEQAARPDLAVQERRGEEALAPPDCSAHEVQCAFRRGEHTKVIALGKADRSPEALYWLARSWQELSQAARERLAKLPDSPEKCLLIAQEHESRGLYLEAAKQYRRALELEPGHPVAETKLAIALFHSRDYAGALPLIQTLLRAKPDSSELHFLHGASLLNMQQPESAIPHLETALRLDPQYTPARAALGHALLNLGQAEAAIPHLKAALVADEDGSRRFQLARAYQLAGRSEEAALMLQEYEAYRAMVEERRNRDERLPDSLK